MTGSEGNGGHAWRGARLFGRTCEFEIERLGGPPMRPTALAFALPPPSSSHDPTKEGPTGHSQSLFPSSGWVVMMVGGVGAVWLSEMGAPS